jgi:hypothetical protein
VVSDVAGDHDSKSQESTTGDFGAPHCSVLVLDAIQYSYPAHWYASYREPCRSKIGAVQTAIEYEYRFTEYRPPRRTEHEYEEIR